MTTANRDTLNDIMEFDHVIEVHADGTVSEPTDVYAPQAYEEGDEPFILDGQDWSLLTGFSGQYNYDGPWMHSSEYIGAGLADHILSHPGLYVAIYPSMLDEDSDADTWAVAFKTTEESL